MRFARELGETPRPAPHLTLLPTRTIPSSDKTASEIMLDAIAHTPLPSRAHTLPRGVHAMPFVYTAGKVLLLIAISAAGVVVAHEECETVGEREGAIESLEEILSLVDPPVIAAAQ